MNLLAVAIIADALIFHGSPADPALSRAIPTTVEHHKGITVVTRPGQSIPTTIVDVHEMNKGPHTTSLSWCGYMITPQEIQERKALEKKFNFKETEEWCPKCHGKDPAMKNCSTCKKKGKLVVKRFRNPRTKQYTEKTDPKKSSFWKSWMKQHPEQEW